MCVCMRSLLALLNWIQQGYFLSFFTIGLSVFYAGGGIFHVHAYVCVFCANMVVRKSFVRLNWQISEVSSAILSANFYQMR